MKRFEPTEAQKKSFPYEIQTWKLHAEYPDGQQDHFVFDLLSSDLDTLDRIHIDRKNREAWVFYKTPEDSDITMFLSYEITTKSGKFYRYIHEENDEKHERLYYVCYFNNMDLQCIGEKQLGYSSNHVAIRSESFDQSKTALYGECSVTRIR